jgi:catechol 2,3-dioxygenase-like lactoylglutathione lyase family enzyme
MPRSMLRAFLGLADKGERQMRQTRLVFFVSLMLVSALAPAFAQSGPTRATAVQRTTLVVSDIDKSVDFYQRIGLLKASDVQSADTDQGGVYGAADLPLTADPKHGRLVVMKGSDDRAGTIGLMWYDRPQLPSARGNLAGIGTGDVIVVIEVPDIQAAYTRLGQIGTRFHLPPTRFTATSADGTSHAGQHMFAYDPDGHIVEVSQIGGR